VRKIFEEAIVYTGYKHICLVTGNKMATFFHHLWNNFIH